MCIIHLHPSQPAMMGLTRPFSPGPPRSSHALEREVTMDATEVAVVYPIQQPCQVFFHIFPSVAIDTGSSPRYNAATFCAMCWLYPPSPSRSTSMTTVTPSPLTQPAGLMSIQPRTRFLVRPRLLTRM